MENCPEEEEDDDDAQVGVLRITTNTFLPCSVLLLHAKPALAVSPALLGCQAAAEMRSSPAHLGEAGPRQSHTLWGQTESKARNTDPSIPDLLLLPSCSTEQLQTSTFRPPFQALQSISPLALLSET